MKIKQMLVQFEDDVWREATPAFLTMWNKHDEALEALLRQTITVNN